MKKLYHIIMFVFIQCSITILGAQPKVAGHKQADMSAQHKTDYDAKTRAAMSATRPGAQSAANASAAAGNSAATTVTFNRKARRAQIPQSAAVATHAEVEKLDKYARARVFAEMKLVIDSSELPSLKNKLQAYIDIQQFTVHEYYRFARFVELLSIHFQTKRYKNLKDSKVAWAEIEPASMISNRCDDQVLTNHADSKVILELKERAQSLMKFLNELPESEQNEHNAFSKSEDIPGIQEYNKLRTDEEYRKGQLQKLNGDSVNNVSWALKTCDSLIQGDGMRSLDWYFLMLLTLDDIENNIFKKTDHIACEWCLRLKQLERNPNRGAKLMRLFEEILPDLNAIKERLMILQISQQQRDLKDKSASVQDARLEEFKACKAKILLEVYNLEMRAIFKKLQKIRIECALLDTYKRAFEIVWTIEGLVAKLDSTSNSGIDVLWTSISENFRSQMKDSNWNLKVVIPSENKTVLINLTDVILMEFKKKISRRLLEMIARGTAKEKDVKELTECGCDINVNDGQFLKLAQSSYPEFVCVLLAHGANPKLFDKKDYRYDEHDPLFKQMADLIESSKLTYKDPKAMEQLKLDQENTAANQESRKARRLRRQQALAMQQLPLVESGAAAAPLSMREKYEQMMLEQKKREEVEKAERLARHLQKQSEKDSKQAKTKNDEVVIDPTATAAAPTPSAAATAREALAPYAHYTISFEQAAKDQIKEIPALQKTINDKLRAFKAGIKTDVKPLSDSDLLRLRVGDYRVKFIVDDPKKTIWVREIKPRKKAYK